MADSSSVWVPVLPSFKDFSKGMEKGTKGAGKAAGDQIAKELEAAVSKSETAVSRAAQAAEKAQNRVADATGKVRVAQEQFNKAIESGDPVKVARAEEALATARRRQGEATTDAEAKSKALAGAQKNLASSQEAVTKNAQEQAREVKASALSAEQAEQASKDLDTANKALAASMVAIVAGAAVVGKGLYDLGSQFDEMFDTIRVGTGASGDAFAGLQESALKVAQTVPAMDGGLSQIGSTMADLNTRLGATGGDLETLTGQFVQLTNMGIDADINSVSQALSGFGISASEAPAAMDELFQISQATGLSITELADSAVKGGPQLRQFGFDMADSAALIGSLDKAGLDADKTIAGMSRAMVAFAKDGREPKKALWETVVEIENFTNAGNDVAALDLAGKMFGTRGAGQFVDAVKSGQLAVDDFVSATGASSDTILGVAEETADFAEQWQLFKQMLAVELAPVAQRVFGAISEAMTWFKDNAVPALRDMADWVGRNKDVLSALAIVVGSMAAGLVIARTGLMAFTAAQRIWNVVTLLSTQGMKGLNMAMKANMFGLITGAIVGLVAGLTWFFTSTETGRAIWESFTGALLTGWEWVKNAFATAWAFIKPVFDGLWGAAQTVGAFLVNGFLLYIRTHWLIVSTAISVIWNTILRPVFTALAAVALWLWNAVLMPVFGWIKTGFQLVGAAFSFYWNTVIKPVWNALGAGIRWVWASIVLPVFDALKAGLGLVGDTFSWVWNNVINPVWTALGNGIRWVADNVVHPVFEGLKRGVDLVAKGFEFATDLIGRVWDSIKEKTAAPIRFVIDTVYNKGIVAVWNKVAGWLGMDDKKLETMPLEFASGGVLPGYTPGRDVHKFINPATGQGLHLSGGEAIMRPEWTRAVGGAAAVDQMNRDAKYGRVRKHGREAAAFADGGVLAFANGGIVAAMTRIVQQKYPMLQMTSGYRNSNDLHGQGMAGDFSNGSGNTPAQLALANDIADTYPGSMELIYDSPGFNRTIKNGQVVGPFGQFYTWGQAGNHQHHVHWAMNTPPTMPFGGGVFEGGSDGSSAGGGSIIGSMVRSAMDAIMNPIMKAIPEGGGLIGGLGKGLGEKVYGTFKDWVLSKVPAGGGGQYGNIDLTGVAGDNLALGEAAAKQVGWTGAEWEALKTLWTGESGWNNNAQNPTSTAYGIAQFLDSTWAPYGPKTSDPAKQIEYGIRYIQDRYGTATGALSFWNAQSPHWYDDGGWLPSGGIGVNESGKPEPVFTNPQWTLIKSLVISTAELLDPIRLMARDGRDAISHLKKIADDTRRGVQHQIDTRMGAVSAAVWAALPGEVKDALTVAEAVGAQWEKVSGYLNEKAIAWSKGEWPIGSARTPVVEPGPGWQQFRLDDSLEEVARANVDLAEQVMAGKLSPGNDPVANALFDIFGRDPILPDLARIAAMGPNAIEAATDAALHAFETGETARLEEWTASNSQLTEAVLRARDAAIVTGQMVQGAVNGYLNWAMASDTQGRQGSWQEYFQHYGGEYGTAQGDWLLSQVGFGGIVGGKFKDSFANLLIATAESPLLSAPPILDDEGRVIGSQLPGSTPEAVGTVEAPQAVELAEPPTVTLPDEAIDLDTAPVEAGTKVSIEIPEGKTALSIDEFKEILVRIDERLDSVEIAIDGEADPAPLGLGVGGIA
ncbi:phage tail tape measure protein [Dietzia sp. ANT_WB102]|uniref:aggregation-promoting factor C-terminal-like domain-containing protein n=1 Tax=Dietzia sp. ANT_WB102 TaxID=2597345 RepID=UPI0011EDFBA1|nr:phage tail tape measure protein [Dietzia sp. ANT_WB102]KAA0916466.1 hypothetical protein FQ137_14685 [Dietzia sp. ANT_WB102]